MWRAVAHACQRSINETQYMRLASPASALYQVDIYCAAVHTDITYNKRTLCVLFRYAIYETILTHFMHTAMAVQTVHKKVKQSLYSTGQALWAPGG